MSNPLPRVKSKELAALLRQAVQNGALVEATRNGHIKVSRPGATPVIAGGTPSDHRVVLNTRARLRRYGYLAL